MSTDIFAIAAGIRQRTVVQDIVKRANVMVVSHIPSAVDVERTSNGSIARQGLGTAAQEEAGM